MRFGVLVIADSISKLTLPDPGISVRLTSGRARVWVLDVDRALSVRVAAGPPGMHPACAGVARARETGLLVIAFKSAKSVF
jgi:hypothetical protein